MGREEYKNPCLRCDCYDEDIGCTMPSIDRSYACPMEDEEEEAGGKADGK